MSCACFWTKEFPLLYLLCLAPNKVAVWTIFNVFSFDAILSLGSNLSPSRQWADALATCFGILLVRRGNYPTGKIWVYSNSCFVTLTLEDDNSGQFYWRHSQGKEQILEYVFFENFSKVHYLFFNSYFSYRIINGFPRI